jgi:hypothetical protein
MTFFTVEIDLMSRNGGMIFDPCIPRLVILCFAMKLDLQMYFCGFRGYDNTQLHRLLIQPTCDRRRSNTAFFLTKSTCIQPQTKPLFPTNQNEEHLRNNAYCYL